MIESDLDAFWVAAEADASLPQNVDSPATRALADTVSAWSRADLALARRAIVGAAALAEDPRWGRALTLMENRIAVRSGRHAEVEKAFAALADLAERMGPGECGTRGRTRHTRAVAALRLNRLDVAEREVFLALPDLDPMARLMALDTWGLVLVGGGAWEEAARILLAVVTGKRRCGDRLGEAISLGTLGRMELSLDRPRSALRYVESLGDLEGLPLLTRIRIETLRVEARLAAAEAGEAKTLSRLVEAAGDDQHYLVGYAHVALARTAESVESWDHHISEARARFSLPDQKAWIELRIAEQRAASTTYDALCAELGMVAHAASAGTEAAVFGELLLATKAHHEGKVEATAQHLERAEGHALRANNSIWSGAVDRVVLRIDPKLYLDRAARRFTGRSYSELAATRRADATVVFVDVVGFTDLSQVVTPEEVMSTSRGFFELAVPVLSRFGVRPLAYLGDALLAIAEDADHRKRGIAFARALVARVHRAGAMRAAAGERVLLKTGVPWSYRVRAGVSSGPVVVGSVGNGFKEELAAIGRTTNLAARLQGQAEADEVVIAVQEGDKLPHGSVVFEAQLRGFVNDLHAARLPLEPLV